jgi:hypothetical protein
LKDYGSKLVHEFLKCCDLDTRKVDEKYMESFEMWCWGKMAKISQTDRVRNEEVLYRVKQERNILRTLKRRKVIWIDQILGRNCLP